MINYKPHLAQIEFMKDGRPRVLFAGSPVPYDYSWIEKYLRYARAYDMDENQIGREVKKMADKGYEGLGGLKDPKIRQESWDRETNQTTQGTATRALTLAERLEYQINAAEMSNVKLKKLERLKTLLIKHKEVAELFELLRDLSLY